MIITQDAIILFKTPPGIYNDCPSQAAFNSMKEVYDDGGNLIHTKASLVLEWEIGDINWFAGQRIEKYYPLWKQANVTREGSAADKATMNTFINAVRTWANQDPIPNPWDGTLEAITA